MQISCTQMDAMAQARFEQRLAGLISGEDERAREALLAPEGREQMRGQIGLARDYGLRSELDISRFVIVAWLLGPGFDTRFPAMAQVLNAPQLEPGQKPSPADARMPPRRGLLGAAMALAFVAAACHSTETNSMSTLDTSKYFTDPRDAAFVDLVQKGDLAGVQAALKAGQSANATGVKGFRPIHFVFAAPGAEVARVLLAAGADPNARLASGNEPLHYAVQQKNPDFTAVLLQYKADPNALGDARQPVLFTALDSPVPEKVLPLLVHAGADINAVWGNNTPVQSAMIGLTWTAAATLLALGADPTVKNPHGEDAGMVFCSLLARLKPTPTNHQVVWSVGNAIKARGVALGCDDKLAQFR